MLSLLTVGKQMQLDPFNSLPFEDISPSLSRENFINEIGYI